MSDRFADRRAVRDKVEWEGGYVAALDYGIRTTDLPEGDTELAEAWDKLWTAYRELGPLVDAVEKLLGDPHDDDDQDPTGVRLPPAECGHEYVLGGVAYGCERPSHGTDGYGQKFRHAAGIDAELAEGTDEGDGYGPATLVTWGEDGNGDGQDWEIVWGTVAGYAADERPAKTEAASGDDL